MPTRTAQLLLALTLLAAAGGTVTACGSGRGAQSRTPARDNPVAKARARQVADAWDGSEAARAWRKGYYPIGEAVQLPEDAFHDEADKQAYESRSFTLRGRLPTAPRKNGLVRWQSGGSLRLPLMEAQQAYEAVAHGGGKGPQLHVTEVKPGEMTLATSRGPATVPAWLFTLDGYDTPLKRAAVRSSEPPTPPIESFAEGSSATLQALQRLVGTAGTSPLRPPRSLRRRACRGRARDGRERGAVRVRRRDEGRSLHRPAAQREADGETGPAARRSRAPGRVHRPAGGLRTAVGARASDLCRGVPGRGT